MSLVLRNDPQCMDGEICHRLPAAVDRMSGSGGGGHLCEGLVRVALHTPDKTRFPSLPLMKLAAWHKTHGDDVSWFVPMFEYDLIYSSKVFTFTPDDPYLPPTAIKGGTGYGMTNILPDEIEHIMPDYELFPHFKASCGFTTRGCIRACPWCIVPKKEGHIQAHAEIAEFLRPDSRDVVLMDNNILAHDHGLYQLEWAAKENLRIDCNQGLDARLIAKDEGIAKILARTHWMRFIRLACDRKEQMDAVEKAVKNIRKYSGKKHEFFCYLLVRDDIEDALERAEFLRNLGISPFAQPYRDFTSNANPSVIQKHFARWVNIKSIFNLIRKKSPASTGGEMNCGFF